MFEFDIIHGMIQFHYGMLIDGFGQIGDLNGMMDAFNEFKQEILVSCFPNHELHALFRRRILL
jgi:pentatricopeptide repeat protein